jgi:7,8-dihydroneopterin aldolase/epimerase/oxygenase
MGIIKIEGMEFWAFHGVLPEEQKTGNKFIVDIELETDFSAAAVSDDLDGTVDYSNVYELVKKEMEVPSKLIEHTAKRIYDTVKSNHIKIRKLAVIVKKFRPPVNGIIHHVSVKIDS